MIVQLTFITAVAPYHAHLIPSIRAQVDQQTIPCAHLVISDDEWRGPGAVRNTGLARADTPFVAFLDADDQIAPTWAEETRAAFEAGGGRRYIYTDHLQDGRLVEAPRCAWVNRTWHVVTALLPTAWARAVGGFDETLPAFEDTDFFMRLIAAGYCGQRLARPLFTYGPGGERSARWHDTPAYDAAMRYFSANYGGRSVGGCCGDPQPGDLIAIGEHLEGDVMAEATWAGNRPERGLITGRVYRTGNWKRTWVDARDAAAKPDHWRPVREAQEAPDFDFTSFADYAQATGDHGGALTNVEEVAAFFMAETQPPAGYEPPPAAIRVDAAPTDARPSAAKIAAKAQRGRKRGSNQRPGAVAAKAEAGA